LCNSLEGIRFFKQDVTLCDLIVPGEYASYWLFSYYLKASGGRAVALFGYGKRTVELRYSSSTV
jgi:hypothetical protein